MASSVFLRPYVEAMSKLTDAPESFHLACAYAIVGALLSRESHKYVLAEGSPRIWTNEYIVLVAPSGSGRKGTCIHMAEAVLLRIDNNDTQPGIPGIRAPDDMSPEGLISHLELRGNGNGGASGIMIQDEWVNLLMQMRRNYSQQLATHLLSFYNVQPEFVRKLKKTYTTIMRPRLSMLSGITLEHLAQFGESEQWEAGFYNRCLFVAAEKTRRQEDQPRLVDKTLDELATKLKEALDLWQGVGAKRNWQLVDFDKPAMLARRGIDTGEGKPQLHRVLERSQVHLAKLSAIEQFDGDPTAWKIGRDAVLRARAFIESWQANIPGIVEAAYARGRSDYEGDRLPRTILRFLRGAKKPVELSEILNVCGLHGRNVRDALFSLIDAGVIEQIADGDVLRYQAKKA